jgi:hypothetical protein
VQQAGLKKFSMELGGKSPFVIFEDADLDRALDAAVFMIFSNNGERCTAGSRILVQQSIYADFAAKFAERAKRITVGDPLDDSTIVGPMISQAHLAKVRSYIELGPKEGATLLCGGLGRPICQSRVKRGNYVLPTVFADVDNRMRIAQEEIFGPVACLIPVQGRGRCDPPGQRHPIRPEQLRVDREHWPRPPRGGSHGSRHVLRQQPERARPAPALWRHQGQRHGARRRHLELRSVLEPKNVGCLLGSHHIPALGHLIPRSGLAAMGARRTIKTGRSPDRGTVTKPASESKETRTMGKLALAAKITHVPSMYLSELDGPRKGTRQDAIDGHLEIDRRCRELGVDTMVVFDTHWLVNASYHVNCAPHFKGVYTSNELPHFISNMGFEFPGNPELGQLLAKVCNEHGVRRWRTTPPRSTPNTAPWCPCAT